LWSPDPLLAQLRAIQSRRGYADDVTEREDAFLLDPGLGLAFYLTSDGRVLVDCREWNEVAWVGPDKAGESIREATPDEAVSIIVAGAKKTGLTGLLGLIPTHPPAAATCHRCLEERWWPIGTNPESGRSKAIVCPICSGRGW
jgi:hypothetical protein